MGLQGQIKDAPGEGNYDEITMKLIGVDGGELELVRLTNLYELVLVLLDMYGLKGTQH